MADDNIVACASGTTAAMCVGAFVGLGIGIWASVKYLEPAFDATTGINAEGAKALTALVDIAGGLESAAGAGALGGAIVFGVAACFLACCGQLCTQRSSASTSRYSAAPSPSLFQRAEPSKAVVTSDAEPTASISMV